MRHPHARDGRKAGADRAYARSGIPQHAGHAGGRALEGATRSLTTQPWGTEGPVQAEVFVVRLRGEQLELTGPCGPDAWYIESHDEDDPMEIVKRLSTNLMGPPLLVHSTSWRRGFGGVLLTFLVVIGEDQALELEGVPVPRTAPARNVAPEAAANVI